VRDFQAGVPGRLRALPVGAKILYTAFAVATLIGLLISAKLYGAIVGDAGPGPYYAGAVATAVAAAPPPSAPAAGGPAIELAPEDAAPKRIVELVSDRKLLEVTHFHIFTIPVYVLILAHLWMLAKIPTWLQNAGVVAAVVTSGLHIAAPWIVRGRPGLGFLMGSSGAAMLLSLGVLAVVSVVDMWLPNPKPPPVSDRLAELRKKRAAAEDRSSPA
jgi:hypothetical protein